MEKQLQINVQLPLLYSKEKVGETLQHFFYAPALDLYGYGYTQEEAKKSFHIHLEEFIDYTIKNKTLHKELERLGWQLKKNKQPEPPSLKEYLNQQSEEFVESLLEKKHKVLKQATPMPFPSYA